MADEATNQAVEEKTEETQDNQNDDTQEDSKAQAQSVEFPEADSQDADDIKKAANEASIELLLDMHIPTTVAIGRIDVPVQRILQLGPGSVLKLDKSIDAPVDLYLKDTRFATGNIVVVDERFAVRIKEIVGNETEI